MEELPLLNDVACVVWNLATAAIIGSLQIYYTQEEKRNAAQKKKMMRKFSISLFTFPLFSELLGPSL